MLPEGKMSERAAVIHVRNWLSHSLGKRGGGQFQALMANLANLCVAETLRLNEGEFELDGRLNAAYGILYDLQNFGFPNGLERLRWDPEDQLDAHARKQLALANASVWRRRDPSRSFREGFSSPHFFSGDPTSLHTSLSSYLELRWLRHPSIDWLFMDMMTTRELTAFGEEIKKVCFPGRKDANGVHVKYWNAKGALDGMVATGLGSIFSSRGDLTDPKSPISVATNVWEAMHEVWKALSGPVINPAMVREEMLKSKSVGAVWDVPSWALIERVIADDASVWLVGPYSQTIAD